MSELQRSPNVQLGSAPAHPLQSTRPANCTRPAQARELTDGTLDTGQGSNRRPQTSQRGSAPQAPIAASATTPRAELDPERIFATSPWRIDWATLLRRVYDVDALQCPGCGGRLRFIEIVTERAEAARWLTRMGLDQEPPAALPHRWADEADVLPRDWDP